MLRELDRVLSRSQTKILGIVATGATPGDAYGYAYGYTSKSRSRSEAPEPAADESELWS